jgi:hypothetical protein
MHSYPMGTKSTLYTILTRREVPNHVTQLIYMVATSKYGDGDTIHFFAVIFNLLVIVVPVNLFLIVGNH